jgi:poly-gamma-glutamate capsule biosynthesis protein CapA/YwtB (metallophosphatase superfamily)
MGKDDGTREAPPDRRRHNGHLEEARNPLVLKGGGGRRVLVVAMASTTSGDPPEWAATEERAGVHLLPEPPEAVVPRVREALERARRPGDLVAELQEDGRLHLRWRT